MEHLQHFGLRQDPFQNEPDLRFYFESVSHLEPYRRIDRGLRQNKGLCVLTGEGGTGKSLLTRRLLEGLEEEIFDAQLMLMMPGASDASSVLSRYARLLGVEDVKADRPGLLGQVFEQLAIAREEGRHSVLMLDDAHLLEKSALSEIGGLLNLEYEDRRLISLLLVGSPQLDVGVGQDPSLGQRVDVRTRLESLDYKNTVDYLQFRIHRVGGDPATIPPDAMSALYKSGGGRPRLLNTLADNALFEAYLAGRARLCAEDVERAAADLGVGLECSDTHSALSYLAGLRADDPTAMETQAAQTVELSEVADPADMAVSSFATSGADLLEGASSADPLMSGPGESASTVGLGEFLQTGTALDGQLETIVPAEGLPADGTDDLDSAVREMLSESHAAAEPPGHDDSHPAAAATTGTRLPDELLDAPAAEFVSELDERFVELIDE